MTQETKDKIEQCLMKAHSTLSKIKQKSDEDEEAMNWIQQAQRLLLMG